MWRLFHYDENVGTIDDYVTRIKQVAALLGYGELQILEVFKSTLCNKLYCVMFAIKDLRQVVDTAKRFLTKEKIDRQLSGWSAKSTQFNKASVSYKSSNKKAVSFNTWETNDKIDNLTLCK